MRQSEHPAPIDTPPVEPKPRAVVSASLLPEVRRYLMMRSVMFGVLIVLLLLHFVAPGAFDLTTILILGGIYLLVVGNGGLEAARLGSGAGDRRQERLAEDALRRAGRLQSHLDPCTATDDVVNRILANGNDARRMVVLAGNEVEDALRAVYRHFSEAERMAGTSNGTDLPLAFLVQELIWRGLLSPDIYDTSEPILALREIALDPRARIEPRTAGDIARATQAVILRIQSLGIEIHPRRTPLAWLKPELHEPEAAEPDHTHALDGANGHEPDATLDFDDEPDHDVEPTPIVDEPQQVESEPVPAHRTEPSFRETVRKEQRSRPLSAEQNDPHG